MNGATPTTQDTPDKGRLQINLVSDITAYPIQGARISISYTGIPETPLEQLTTDSSGQTDIIDLAAPPLEYSLDPENEIQPYSEYTFNKYLLPDMNPSALPEQRFCPRNSPAECQHETRR